MTVDRHDAHCTRRALFVAIGLVAAALGEGSHAALAAGEPIHFGVSGPLTGPNAQYGEQWKAGFDLALEEVNADGGVLGRPLAYVFEDSQSDPRQSVFVKAAAERGAQVVAVEGYLADEKDLRSTLVRVRDAKPDGIVLISYYADGALIAGQVRTTGINLPLVAVGSVYSPKFIELGGAAVNGIYTNTTFFPEEPRAEVQNFVKRFRARYNREPDAFNAYAYDAVIIVAQAIRTAGSTDRKAIRDALYKIKDVRSIVFGKASFDAKTRRVIGVRSVDLVIRDGKWTRAGSARAANRLPAWRIQIGSGTIGALDLLIAGIGVASAAILFGFLRFTRLGWAVRASAQDRDAAQQMGVDIHAVNQAVFAIASALGGLSGLLVGMYYNHISPAMSFQATLEGVVAVLIGGAGNVPGAIAGSLRTCTRTSTTRPSPRRSRSWRSRS